jgi:hypothetical protein
MWYGFLLGLGYAAIGFRGTSNAPRLDFMLCPFQKGIAGGFHHWRVYGIVFMVALSIQSTNISTFSLVMTLHGLTYPDAFEL